MEGKIKLRIGSKSSFWNRRYKVFLNGNSVGNIDYKNSQISFGANKGNNLLLVKSKTFEKELSTPILSGAVVLARTVGAPPPKMVAPIAPAPAIKARRELLR